jgi:hypothetical protein
MTAPRRPIHDMVAMMVPPMMVPRLRGVNKYKHSRERGRTSRQLHYV